LFPDLIGAANFCNLMVAEETQQMKEEDIVLAHGRVTAPTVLEVIPAAQTEPAAALIEALRTVLNMPQDAAQVEASRLELIAREVASEITKNQYVDWEKRESIKAAMRNAARVVLRKYGYPAGVREEVLDKLFVVIGAAQAESAQGQEAER
jgi:hypothetical protein